MLYYGISESLIKRTVRFPKRKEEGVAAKTTAVMQPYGRPLKSNKPYGGEIWVMYQEMSGAQQTPSMLGSKKRIISSWRYPGVSPVGKKIPIPDEILQELGDLIE